jgi:hypothetical protein
LLGGRIEFDHFVVVFSVSSLRAGVLARRTQVGKGSCGRELEATCNAGTISGDELALSSTIDMHYVTVKRVGRSGRASEVVRWWSDGILQARDLPRRNAE